MTEEIIEMWVFGVDSGIGADPTQGVDVTGFGVEALDGSIGKIDEATYEENAHGLVVDTGPWIFGKKNVLPAGVIERVDANEGKVYVSRTKDQIKDSPRFDDTELDEDARGQDSTTGLVSSETSCCIAWRTHQEAKAQNGVPRPGS